MTSTKTSGTSWIGRCTFGKDKDVSEFGFSAIVAVNCGDRATFENEVRAFAMQRAYKLTMVEDIQPAELWLDAHPDFHPVAALSRAVSDLKPVELCVLDEPRLELMSLPQIEPHLLLDEISVEPLDLQIGVDQRRCVPDSIHPVLFGDTPLAAYKSAKTSGTELDGRTGQLGSFAILDAARVPNLPLFLEGSGLPHSCLFQGEAEQELRSVAPYIVQLSDDADFTRHLFTAAGMPSDMWDLDPGIFLRSRMPIGHLRKHFRKFTRLYDDAQKVWKMFRFYDATVLQTVIAQFDDSQFELFGRGIECFACRGQHDSLCVLVRRPRIRDVRVF